MNKTTVATGLIALVLGFGSSLAFQADAVTTFTAIDEASTPLEQIVVKAETSVTQTRDYTKGDVQRDIDSIDSDITRLQADRASLVEVLTAIQTELDKLPARVERVEI